MMKPLEPATCRDCGATPLHDFETYKHRWSVCPACGVFRRFSKEHYTLESLLPRPLARKFFGGAALKLERTRSVHDDSTTQYDYMIHDIRRGSAIYDERTRVHLADFAARGIEIDGKEILDVSGGPGFLARDLAARAKRVVVTEYGAPVVEAMTETFKRDGFVACVLDMNAAAPFERIEGRFDLVLLRWVLSFCLDLGAFARALRAATRRDGLVYLLCGPPALGYCLRWQLEEYTSLVLYPKAAKVRHFESAGFQLVDESVMNPQAHYLHYWSTPPDELRLLRYLSSYYGAKALWSCPELRTLAPLPWCPQHCLIFKAV